MILRRSDAPSISSRRPRQSWRPYTFWNRPLFLKSPIWSVSAYDNLPAKSAFDGATVVDVGPPLAEMPLRLGSCYVLAMSRHENPEVVQEVTRENEDSIRDHFPSIGASSAPVVAVVSPLNGDSVIGVVRVQAEAVDDVSVVGVQFLLDGHPIDSPRVLPPYVVSIDTTLLANGPHTLAAVATDAVGYTTTSAAVTVYVRNEVSGSVLDAAHRTAGEPHESFFVDLSSATLASRAAVRSDGRGVESETRPVRRATEAEPILLDELRRLAASRFGEMVKAVVDLRRRVMLLDADMHADQEAELLAEGAAPDDLWGINLYPDLSGDDWLEFDSMINLRPSFGNRSRGVDDEATRTALRDVVVRLVRR